MSMLWKDMTIDEKLEWLRYQDQSTNKWSLELAPVLMKSGCRRWVEKQINELQARIARQSGAPRRILKLRSRSGGDLARASKPHGPGG